MYLIHSALREFAPPSSNPYVVKSREFSAMKMPWGESNVSRAQKGDPTASLDHYSLSIAIAKPRIIVTGTDGESKGKAPKHLEILLLSQMTFARCVLRKWAVENYTYFVVRHTLLVAHYHWRPFRIPVVDSRRHRARISQERCRILMSVLGKMVPRTKLSWCSNLLTIRELEILSRSLILEFYDVLNNRKIIIGSKIPKEITSS